MSDLRDVPPKTGILMGTAFLVAGLAIVFIALDWIQVDPSSIHAPRWVLGACGVMFGLPGAGLLYYAFVNLATGGSSGAGRAEGGGEEERFPVVSWLIGLAIAGGLAVVAGWVAFGPGERTFSGGAAVGPVHVGGASASETLGRAVFGVGAVLAGAFTLWGLVYGLRRLAGRGGAGRTSSTRGPGEPGGP